METFYIMRGRFQPFCEDQLDAVVGFFREFVNVPSGEKAYLVLLVVRHFFTLDMSARIWEENNITDYFFRHHPVFNPLRMSEVQLQVYDALWNAASSTNENVHFETPEEIVAFKKFVTHRLLVLTSHLSVREFAGLLPNIDKARESDKEIQSTARLLLPPERLATKTKSTSVESIAIVTHFIKSLKADLQFSDPINGRSTRWFIPIFDMGDIEDIEMLLEVVLAEDAVVGRVHPGYLRYAEAGKAYNYREGSASIFLSHPVNRPHGLPLLSAYGYYAYLQVVAQDDLTNKDAESIRVREFLESVSRSDFNRFAIALRKVTISKELRDKASMSEFEKYIANLEVPKEFDQRLKAGHGRRFAHIRDLLLAPRRIGEINRPRTAITKTPTPDDTPKSLSRKVRDELEQKCQSLINNYGGLTGLTDDNTPWQPVIVSISEIKRLLENGCRFTGDLGAISGVLSALEKTQATTTKADLAVLKEFQSNLKWEDA